MWEWDTHDSDIVVRIIVLIKAAAAEVLWTES
jgi:hypothetical protein